MDALGRDDELRTLHDFLERPAEGMAALVLEGEAGIGKSTLWLSGVEAARERGFRVLSSRPAEVELGIAYAGLGDLFDDAFGDVLPELASPQRRALEIALLVADDTDAPVDFRTLAVAVRSALRLLAERQPTLIAIDDVQWLNRPSASALEYALRRLPSVDIRLLFARRAGEGAPMSELERALDASLVERVRVGPFSAGALHAILQPRFNRVFARPTLLRLHEASGGNPFFALELGRSLGDNLVDPSQPLAFPRALGALVQARLDGLPDETRRALLLVCAHGRLTPAQLDDDTLEPAFADNVIELADGVIRFTHPLLASAVYQGVSPETRRRAHERVAEMVADPLARARHRALAAEKPDAEIAAELEAAAAVAVMRGAPLVAAELGEHALRATPPNAGGDRHRRALATARAHLASGDGTRPRAIALELLVEAPAGTARAEALVLLSELEGVHRAIELLEEALDAAGQDAALKASLHRRLGILGRLTKGMKWAERHARAAVDVADELEDDALRAGALSALAFLRFNGGDADAPRDAERAYELALACGDREQLDRAESVLSHVLAWSIQTERARDLLGSHLARREQDERVGAGAHWLLALVEWRAGRWAESEQHAEAAYAIKTQYGNLAPYDVFPLALVVAHRGDLERARELAERGRELADREGAHLGGLVALAGVVEHWSGNPGAAAGWFAKGEAAADAAGWGEPNLRWWRADYAETLIALDRIDDAVALLNAWESDGERVGRDWVLVQVARCRGLLAAAQGDVEQALSLLEEAAGKHEAADDQFGRARALLALGVIRRRARQKRPAREAIEAALAGFETLGAAGWAEKARGELGAISGRTRAEGLTAAEQRVAALVAEGRTNREVATALFLAERTVASHLSHVYPKLGVRSRTELARKLQTF